MIISHRHRFIFLKTEKTASSSLWSVFKAIAGERDRLYPADQRVRRELITSHGSLENVSFIGSNGAGRRLLPGVFGLYRHAFASDVRAFIGPDLFERYMVITSERNPFDRQLSLFAHRRQKHGAVDLSRFSGAMESPMYNLLHYNRLRNWDVYAIDGKVCASHVIRFENLQDDLGAVLRDLGIDPEAHMLPHLKKTRPYATYREFYSDRARQLVSRWYRREIAHFGYAF